jgi:hypothetical protein
MDLAAFAASPCSALFALVPAVLLCAAGSGQTDHRIATPIDVVARATGQSEPRTIPAGPIGTGQHTFALASSNQITSRVDTGVLPFGNGASWSLDVSSVVTGFSFGSGSASLDSGDLLLQWANVRAGALVVGVSGSTTGIASVRADVDVGADGSIEVSAGAGTLRRELRVCTAGTLLVRVTVRGSASSSGPSGLSGSATLGVDVSFVPGLQPATFTAYGPSCGPLLAGVDGPAGLEHRLAFTATGGFPQGSMAFLFGLDRVAIGFGRCVLLTTPLVAFVVPADGNGAATLTIPVFGPLSAVLDAQAAALDAAFNLATTNGLEIELRDC